VIWPAAHFINFRFVPTEQRILYNNVVSVSFFCHTENSSHKMELAWADCPGLEQWLSLVFYREEEGGDFQRDFVLANESFLVLCGIGS